MNTVETRIKSCEKLVYKISHFYAKNNYQLREELIAEGMLGLTEAAVRFDSTRDNKFISYAYGYIRGYILRYVDSFYNHEVSLESLLEDGVEVEELADSVTVTDIDEALDFHHHFAHLSDNEQKTIRFRLEGKTFSEIADGLLNREYSIGAIKAIEERAIQKLKCNV